MYCKQPWHKVFDFIAQDQFYLVVFPSYQMFQLLDSRLQICSFSLNSIRTHKLSPHKVSNLATQNQFCLVIIPCSCMFQPIGPKLWNCTFSLNYIKTNFRIVFLLKNKIKSICLCFNNSIQQFMSLPSPMICFKHLYKR